VIWLWLIDAVAGVLSWFSSWWPDWSIPWPDAIAIAVPVPLGLAAGDGLDTWLTWTLLVAGVLVIGRGLYWLYRIIPANG
jgi:hypothetical protein